MLKVTKINNLFQSNHRLTTAVIPLHILHPAIETSIIEQYGDTIQSAHIIHVLGRENTIIPYTCITGTNGNMYRIEYIDVSEVYLSGYNSGHNGFDITVNPYHPSVPEHLEW